MKSHVTMYLLLMMAEKMADLWLNTGYSYHVAGIQMVIMDSTSRRIVALSDFMKKLFVGCNNSYYVAATRHHPIITYIRVKSLLWPTVLKLH